MDWLKAIISFLLAIIIIGISSLLISVVTEQISDFSSVAGGRESNITLFLSNFGSYVLTLFGLFILTPLLYILLGGVEKERILR